MFFKVIKTWLHTSFYISCCKDPLELRTTTSFSSSIPLNGLLVKHKIIVQQCVYYHCCLISSEQYRTQEYSGKEKLANSANCELLAKIFFTNIHRYTENVFDIILCTDCSLFTKFFLANSFFFYLYGSPKSSPTKIYPCMVARTFVA